MMGILPLNLKQMFTVVHKDRRALSMTTLLKGTLADSWNGHFG
jgi:hypothetical protein